MMFEEGETSCLLRWLLMEGSFVRKKTRCVSDSRSVCLEILGTFEHVLCLCVFLYILSAKNNAVRVFVWGFDFVGWPEKNVRNALLAQGETNVTKT